MAAVHGRDMSPMATRGSSVKESNVQMNLLGDGARVGIVVRG